MAVLRAATDADGRPWVRVRLAVLPNGTTGWVRAHGARRLRHRTHAPRRRPRRGCEATLDRDGPAGPARCPSASARRAGRRRTGEFYVRNRLTRYRSPAYGPVAFGTSARSPHATDWPAGGFVGIHGTDRPDLVPGRVSHGCIRLRNADIRALARLMPVGTPVTIR